MTIPAPETYDLMMRKLRFFISLHFLLLLLTQTSHAGQEKGVERFLSRHDGNGDGVVLEEEFRGHRRMFERFDLDADGRITPNEFKQARRIRAQNDRKSPSERPVMPLPDGVKVLRELEYAVVGGESLQLDLYLPKNTTADALVVWVHGGGWRRGDKSQINAAIVKLATEGYAVASVNYRLVGVVEHPKQLHDIKGAVRWLRANAGKYPYTAERIGIGGGSAGGHLALLLGLSADEGALEGEVGGNLSEPSRVQAILDLYGPSDLEAFAEARPQFRGRKSDALLRAASPLTYLSKDDPPLLILHGDQDEGVPLSQSELLHQRYQRLGLESRLHVIPGAGHGGRPFKSEASYRLIKDFFDRHLRPSAQASSNRTLRAAGPDQSTASAAFGRSQKNPPLVADVDRRLHGFHWMIGPKSGLEGDAERFDRLLQSIDKNLSKNPYISGVYLIYHWRLLEPAEGRLDFTRLDQVIERVRKHGRYYKLALNPGLYTPDWVYVKGARSFETRGSNPARKQIYQQTIRIPIPWDPVYQASYFNTLSKLAERYRGDAAFRAISLTVATFMSPEWHLPKSPLDRQKWLSQEGFPARLEEAWKQGIDRFAALFANQFLVLEASSYPLGLKALGDAVVAHAVSRHPGRIAIQINQLHGRFDQAEQGTYRKLLAYRNQYGEKILIGLQNLKGWGHAKTRERQGSEEMSAYNFVQAGGDYWELWYHDGQNRDICRTLHELRHTADKLGLEDFKRELIKTGEYRPIRGIPSAAHGR